MMRCDLPHFDQATALVDAPSSLRYAYWRARIKGSLGDLLTRSRNSQETDDTRHVRQILDGYRAIQTMGYCASVGKAVAG